MEQAQNWAWGWLGLSSAGFYLFLAVWIGMAIWSRTKEKLAVQETLRKLIDRGTEVSPEVIEALKTTKPKRSAAEIKMSVLRTRYWGLFLTVLGIVITLWTLRYTDRPVIGIVFFLIPGLFCLAWSFITTRTRLPLLQQ